MLGLWCVEVVAEVSAIYHVGLGNYDVSCIETPIISNNRLAIELVEAVETRGDDRIYVALSQLEV